MFNCKVETVVTENDARKHSMACETIQTISMVAAAASAIGMCLLVLFKK